MNEWLNSAQGCLKQKYTFYSLIQIEIKLEFWRFLLDYLLFMMASSKDMFISMKFQGMIEFNWIKNEMNSSYYFNLNFGLICHSEV